MKIKQPVYPYIMVCPSSIHGWGVFAKKDIPKDTRIMEYVGEKVTKKESDRRGKMLVDRHKANGSYGAVYLFELNKRHDIDGNVPYNTARFINHSCEPNTEVDVIRGKIWVTAIQDIKRGEEIFYNYGYDIDDYLDHRCFCGTKRCVEYIVAEEHWPQLDRILSGKEVLPKKNKKNRDKSFLEKGHNGRKTTRSHKSPGHKFGPIAQC